MRRSVMSHTAFTVPFRDNLKLKRIQDMINEDARLLTYWRCANVFAIDRMGYSDHGPTHIKIVANLALRLLRIVVKRGITPSVVKDYKKTPEDAEVIVVLASALHDLGMTISRESHEEYSLVVSKSFLDQYLPPLYGGEDAVIIASEIMHAIISHHKGMKPVTLEAGIVRVADALDMEKGRARIPFSAGRVNIHSVSASSIEQVRVEEGRDVPIVIKIRMSNSAGIFQIDELLRGKIRDSGLEKYVQVIAEIAGKTERKIIEKFQI